MNLKRALVVIVCIAFVASCKKGASPFAGPKVNTITDFRSGAVSTYTYNADGTCSVIQKNGVGKTVFYYDGDTCVLSDINTANVTTDAYIYFRNSSGYADTAIGEFQLQHNSTAFQYDADGIPDQVRYYTLGSLAAVDYYTKSNKNVTELAHWNVTANTHNYDYYIYSSTYTNSTGVQNKGLFHLGASSNNLVLSDIKIGNNLDTTDIITYRYKYDGSSRVDTFATYNRAGQLVDTMGVSYY